ncbi:MAG: hypothetical protein ACRDQD_00520 [Nocardioidaceae bacterium]
MTDEPSVHELSRAIAAVQRTVETGQAQVLARMDHLVTRELFVVELARRDDRIKALEDDLITEQKAREKAEARLGTWVRSLLVGLLVPLALFIGNLVWGKP